MKRLFPFTIIFTTVILLYYPVIFTFFSQDDFFHFKVSLTDGSFSQFINLFGFHPFTERGIAFYRPVFREMLFNINYSLFGLNPYPFRILQISLLFLNAILVYLLISKLIKIKYLPFFVAFFYAICSAQVASLYYLAGGIQVLGATTFLLLTLIFTQNNLYLAFITFLLALGSHELASVIPLLMTALFFVVHPFIIARKKIWQLLPFFLVLIIYLYLEINIIGFSSSEVQYKMVFNIKTILNSYMWYTGWALGLPEMLVDFIFPGFKLNPDLMRYWGNYYIIIFTSFFSSLFLILLGLVAFVIKKRDFSINRVISNNKTILFFIFWFFISLLPIILLPLHKSTQYLETGLPAFWSIIGLIVFTIYQKIKYKKNFLLILLISLLTLSSTSILLQRTTYWATQRGKFAKHLIENVTSIYPVLPKGSIIYFKNDPNYPFISSEWGSSSKQAAFILNNEDALRLVYKDPTLKVFYEDSNNIPTELISNKLYIVISKIQ